MGHESDSFFENLTSLTLAIGERKDLRDWFHQLAEKSPRERAELIFEMSQRLSDEAEDIALADSVKHLTDPRIFEATCLALQQCDPPDQ